MTPTDRTFLQTALERIRDKLIRMGARLPIEVKGTIESAMTSGHSHALLLVEDEIAALQSRLAEPVLSIPPERSGQAVQRPVDAGEVMDMALCESQTCVLRIGQLYRFRPVGDCETCAKLKAAHDEAYAPFGLDTASTDAGDSDDVTCGCGDIYERDTFEGGYITATGRCSNCVAMKGTAPPSPLSPTPTDRARGVSEALGTDDKADMANTLIHPNDVGKPVTSTVTSADHPGEPNPYRGVSEASRPDEQLLGDAKAGRPVSLEEANRLLHGPLLGAPVGTTVHVRLPPEEAARFSPEPAAAPQSGPNLRAEFEALARSKGFSERQLAQDGNDYIDDNASIAWWWFGWSREALTASQATEQPKTTQPSKVTDEMVSRFLCWSLPNGFSPDCGISFDGRKDDQWNKNKTWPIGTNLLDALQARQMLEHVLAVTEQPADRAQRDEPVIYCAEKRKPGGCQLHNLHCGWPSCNNAPKGK